jgi:predicted secreted acid phosphatase
MSKIYVFDIDGTVADNSARTKWVEQTPKDWKKYNETMANDKPIADIIELLQTLDDGFNTIIFCTGREEVYREVTEKWLRENNIVGNPVYMRAAKDYRSDSIVKVELLNQIRQEYGEPFMWFDDRDSVVSAIRAQGVRVLQVRPGAF